MLRGVSGLSGTLIDTGEAVLVGDREESVAVLHERIGADPLGECVDGLPCRHRQRCARHSRCRDRPLSRSAQVASGLLVAALRSDTGRDDLLLALDLVHRLDQGAIKASFLPAGRRRCGMIPASSGARSGRPHWRWPSAMRCAPATSTCLTVASMPDSGRWCRTSACGRVPAPPAMPISACPNSQGTSCPVGRRDWKRRHSLRRRVACQQLRPCRSGAIEPAPSPPSCGPCAD
jgi:hypothetical protein